jgi:ribose transport system substrate-binding protein
MVDKQIEMLQAALDKNPAALCLAALDSKAAIPLLEEGSNRRHPGRRLRLWRRQRHPGRPRPPRTTSPRPALAADKMAELIGGEGQVAVLVHDQTSRTGIDRRDGFVNSIEAKYPKIEIVDIQYGGGDQLKSTDLAKAIIQAHPNLKGFFGANEGSIIGVLNAVKELGKEGKITVIGYDSGKQQMDAIRERRRGRRDHAGPDWHWLQVR